MIDAEATNQLRALGFKFEGDVQVALLRGDVIVSVMRLPEHPDLFALTITVPKGITFNAFMRRKDLLEAYRIRETCGLRQKRSVAAQQRIIRDLSKRYRELRDRKITPEPARGSGTR